MITNTQQFFEGKEINILVHHSPAKLSLEYKLIFEQKDNSVEIDLFDLKRILRVANKNKKEID